MLHHPLAPSIDMRITKMITHILPAILEDADIRTAEAQRVAYEIRFTEKLPVQQAIARYGQFVENNQAVLPVAMKDFYRAVSGSRAYQETVAPLRGHDLQHDDFDNKLALAVYRLLNK